VSYPVKILAQCTNPELLKATTMVFETLRVGFPTAEVTVYWKGLDKSSEWKAVGDACQKAEVQHFFSIPEGPHADWIQRMVEENQEPFYLCDTDMVFWKSFEGFRFGEAPLAGRFVPQFFDKFTQCATRPRLHTALLYIDPDRVRSATQSYFEAVPNTPYNPRPNLYRPVFYPFRTGKVLRNYFHDVCGLLYQAIGGASFHVEHLDANDHMQCGTIVDTVGARYPDMRICNYAAMDNPKILKGAWRQDDAFYAANAC
jgi:hypothetical protein